MEIEKILKPKFTQEENEAIKIVSNLIQEACDMSVKSCRDCPFCEGCDEIGSSNIIESLLTKMLNN